ncbi:prepilin peptidase [Blastochloris sulfoviridis]|uniref:Prepilin peptidase n=1 Tax=Blastochloris sulfoviridis TaxID=50712 RepID=A0A5M6I624_9HYPH|nr:prepilin peptidase [Blastochloris sulfoviridis]KAA5603696.1 prepilin peptidase [Blastochloris sulfoviridis]
MTTDTFDVKSGQGAGVSPATSASPPLERARGAAVPVIAFAAAGVSIAALPGLAGWLGAGLAAIMVAIAAIDARRFIIPDSLNAAALLLGLGHAAAAASAMGDDGVQALAAAALRGGVLAAMFFVLREIHLRLRGREGLGLGDVKLAAVAGVWLGWLVMPLAVEIAALSALAAYAVRYAMLRRRGLRRRLRPTGRLPFGLFFAPAIWLGWLLEAVLYVV